jgi:hypothetical protein
MLVYVVVNPLYPDQYIDFVVISGVKLDHWCREELYEKFVLHLIKTEPVEVALERSISHMLTWAEDQGSVWNHYFLYVSLSRATYDIKDGKISPWLVLNSANGKSMLKKMGDDQLSAISNIIDPQVWRKKFKQQRTDLEFVKQVVKESTL